MTYRPLNNNEYVIVSRTIYEERKLTGGLAESMLMAYKARALALDEPEFDIFKESEEERKTSLLTKQLDCDIEKNKELGPMEFLQKLDELSKNEKPSNQPKNAFEWFFGDESSLDARYKRLRVKFYNSERYRRQALRRYLEDGILRDEHLKDLTTISHIIGEFHQRYSGTRQGIISYYEILFGDPSGFSYRMAMERESFFRDPAYRSEVLTRLKLPINCGLDEIRGFLEKDALKTGTATSEQVARWKDLAAVNLSTPHSG